MSWPLLPPIYTALQNLNHTCYLSSDFFYVVHLTLPEKNNNSLPLRLLSTFYDGTSPL